MSVRCFFIQRFGSKTDEQSGGDRKGRRQKNQRALRNGTNRPKRLSRKPRRAKARWTRTADITRSHLTQAMCVRGIMGSDVDSTTYWWCDKNIVAMLHTCTYLHFIIASVSIYI